MVILVADRQGYGTDMNFFLVRNFNEKAFQARDIVIS